MIADNPYTNYKILNLAIPLITLVIFGVYLFFVFSAQIKGTVLESVFDNRTISEAVIALDTDLTPPPWNFYIWDLINIWQAAWLFFVMGVTFCSTKSFKCPLWMYITFGLAIIMSSIWTVTFTHLKAVGSFIVITIGAILLIINYFCTCYHVEYKMAMCIPHWLLVGLRVFLLNGLGLFASYIFSVFFLSFDMMLVNDTSAEKLTSAVTLLAFFGAFIIIYFALDMTKYADIFNFVWTPYCIWIWVLAGIVDHYVSKDLSLNYAVSIVTLVLLAFVTIVFIFKVCYTFKRLKCGKSICQKFYHSISQLGDDEICIKPKFKFPKTKKTNYQAPFKHSSPPKTSQHLAKDDPCQAIKIQVCSEKGGDKQTTKNHIKQDVASPSTALCKSKMEPPTHVQHETPKQSQL